MASIDSKLIFERYSHINNNDHVIYNLYRNDIKAIEELLIEAGFFKNVANKFGNAASNLASTAKNIYNTGAQVVQGFKGSGNPEVDKLIKQLTSIIFKSTDDAVKGLSTVISGKVDRESLDRVKKGLSEPAKGVKNESNKQFIARVFFQEEILLEAFKKNPILLEQNSANDLDQMAQVVANKIKQMYPNATDLSAFTKKVNQYLTPPEEGKAAQTSGNQQAGGGGGQQAGGGGGQQAGGGGQQAAASGGEQKQGLLQRITQFAKNNPKMSVGAAVATLGVVAAAFGAAGPALITTALLSGLKNAGIASIVEIGKQLWKNRAMNLKDNAKNIDWKSVGKTAAVGGILGTIGKVISTGIGTIASGIGSLVGGGGGSGGTVGAYNRVNQFNPANPNEVLQARSPQSGGMNFDGSGEEANQQSGNQTAQQASAQQVPPQQVTGQQVPPQQVAGQQVPPQQVPPQQVPPQQTQAPMDQTTQDQQPQQKPKGSAWDRHFSDARNKMNYQRELVQTIKQSGYEGGTVKLVGGVPVDANNNPLLPDEKLQQLQAKYNMPVTQNPRQSINAAIQIRDAMSGVGGSQGGSGRANVSNSNDW